MSAKDNKPATKVDSVKSDTHAKRIALMRELKPIVKINEDKTQITVNLSEKSSGKLVISNLRDQCLFETHATNANDSVQLYYLIKRIAQKNVDTAIPFARAIETLIAKPAKERKAKAESKNMRDFTYADIVVRATRRSDAIVLIQSQLAQAPIEDMNALKAARALALDSSLVIDSRTNVANENA